MSHQPANTDIFRYRAVERRVLELIENGALHPGERAPSLRQMSRRMGVGIASVNHAYLELERKGVLDARPRSGFFVREASPGLELPAPVASKPSSPRPSTRSGLIRTVLESVGDKQLAPFGVVCPEDALLPGKMLTRLTAAIVKERGETAMGYAPVPGVAHLRRLLAWRMSEQGALVQPDEVVVTNGCMEALSIALRSLTRPGDVVCIQSPTYYCFLQLLETLGLRAVELSSCPTSGIAPADVAAAVERHEVKACIFSGNYNNPDGALTPEPAKTEIVKLLAARGIPLVEDDVSGDLYAGDVRPGSFKSHDRSGLVIYCSSFSKTIAPGFRIGWMAPGRFLHKALELKATTSVCTASLTQEVVAAFLAGGGFEKHLHKLRQEVQQVMRAIRHHVAAQFPEGTRMTRPSGGLVLWVELPEGKGGVPLDAVELFYLARENGVGIAPGPIFTTQDRFANCLRLSCGLKWNDRTMQGLATLGRLAGQMGAV